MGNSCFITTKNCIQKHLDICVDKTISNIDVDNPVVDENYSNNQINRLKNYFIKNEQDISEDLYKRNIKATSKKKRNSGFINLLLIDKNKYETMLKNLLTQKHTEIKGPKRRETIRFGDKINNLVKEVINEKNSNRNNKLKRAPSKRLHSIIIKNKDRPRIRQSTTLYRRDSLYSKNVNKIMKSQLKKVNTLNEILTDGNHSTIFNKKETNKI